ncbi:MAG: hypothetical protein V1734_03870 [Nanoarchaeota archaeon]
MDANYIFTPSDGLVEKLLDGIGYKPAYRCVNERTIDGLIQRTLEKIPSRNKKAARLQKSKVADEIKGRLGERVRSYIAGLARGQQCLLETSEEIASTFLIVEKSLRFPAHFTKGLAQRVGMNVIPSIPGLEDCIGKRVPALVYHEMAAEFYGWVKETHPADPTNFTYEFHDDGALYVNVAGMNPMSDYKWTISGSEESRAVVRRLKF